MMITQNRLDQIMMYFTKCTFEVKEGYHDRTLFSSSLIYNMSHLRSVCSNVPDTLGVNPF